MGLFGLFGRGKKEPPPPPPGADGLPPLSADAAAIKLEPLEPLTPRPPRSGKRPKLTDEDRDVFAYARDMTAYNVWYYRDRLSTPRGPCPLHTLRQAWVAGVIDEDTLVWGQGLMDWLPIRNVRTLVPQIRTPEVQLATWIKRKLVIEPSLRAVRKQRAEQRPEEAGQEQYMR